MLFTLYNLSYDNVLTLNRSVGLIVWWLIQCTLSNLWNWNNVDIKVKILTYFVADNSYWRGFIGSVGKQHLECSVLNGFDLMLNR